MCTLIALHRCFAEAPLLIAANRDEYLDRPAAPPELGRAGARTTVAPRDLRAGGTWLGVNDAGLFAGLTNRPTSSPDPERRSRGLLVNDALSAGSAGEAAAALASLGGRAYNPFNLFVADGSEAFVAVYEEEVRVTRLAPGAHVIGNADPNCGTVPKIARLLAEAEQVAAGRIDDSLDALARVCRAHGAGGTALEDTCIHAGGYGTRSSTLLRLTPDREGRALRFANGPPCETDYEDLTSLLDELDRKSVLAREVA